MDTSPFVLLFPYLLLPLFLAACLACFFVPFLLLWLYRAIFPPQRSRAHHSQAGDDEDVLNQNSRAYHSYAGDYEKVLNQNSRAHHSYADDDEEVLNQDLEELADDWMDQH